MVPELFRLVLEEIGSKPRKRGGSAARSWASAWRLYLLRGAPWRMGVPWRCSIRANTAAKRPRSRRLPPTFQPARLVRRCGADNALVNVNVPLGPGSAFDPESGGRTFQAEDSLALKKRRKKRNGHRVPRYARFPLAAVSSPMATAFRSAFSDMRFASELAGRRGIAAVIHLNAQSLVIDGNLNFDAPPSN